jgi:hypothetical protein
VAFQLAEMAVPRALLAGFLRRIGSPAANAAAASGMSTESDQRRQPSGRGASCA